MSQMKKNGASKLASVLDSRMNEHGENGLQLDFGIINDDYSLTCNTFQIPVPKDDYSVCSFLSGLTVSVGGGNHNGHSSGNGSHKHTVQMPKLKPGDRVLVAWVDDEPVVVDRIGTMTDT